MILLPFYGGHSMKLICKFTRYVISGVTVAAASASRDLVKDNEEEVDNARATEHYSKAAPATSIGVGSENGGSTHFVRVSVGIFTSPLKFH